MGTLKVTLHTKAYLISTNVLEAVDNSLELEGNIEGIQYFTDIIGYRFPATLDGMDATLTKYVSDDDCSNGDIWETKEGVLVHKLWIKDFTVTNDYINYRGTTYTLLLNKSRSSRCTECSSMTTHESGLCTACFIRKYTNINSYSFKPKPIFYGEQLELDKRNPVWYGIELEHSATNDKNVAEYNYKHNKDKPYFYMKSDSSIYSSNIPFEMVTHPHSFKELMASEWLEHLNELKVLNNSDTRVKNGCHIHISNTAFVDDSHYSRWYFFVYSLASGILQRIANRELTSYCQNVKYDTIYNKELVQKGSECAREVIINERNNKTREVRVFSTTTDPKVLKSYIQFLESTIKYSKYAKDTLCYDDYVAYIVKYASKYQELLDVVSGIEGTKRPKPIIVPTKVVTVGSIEDIPAANLGLIVRVKINGKKIKVSSITIDFISEIARVNGDTCSFNDIDEVEYATN